MKADDRRAAIIDRLADHVLAEGLSGSSLRPLAKAAGISDRMLLYYFKDKAEVIAATLDCIAARLTGLLAARRSPQPLPLDRLRAELVAALMDEALWPYMRVWLDVAAQAAYGDAALHAIGERIGRGFLAWGESQLDSATPEQRAIDAARLLVTIEGNLLLKSLGLEDVARRAV
ncbi:MAG: hypothetical protein B7Y45_02920 [Sphingomonas sp. 28-66-16]|nr:MAG: hypothetical protein B7Y45_02920 [Sphingomonas sp. 28-66-16]